MKPEDFDRLMHTDFKKVETEVELVDKLDILGKFKASISSVANNPPEPEAPWTGGLTTDFKASDLKEMARIFDMLAGMFTAARDAAVEVETLDDYHESKDTCLKIMAGFYLDLGVSTLRGFATVVNKADVRDQLAKMKKTVEEGGDAGMVDYDPETGELRIIGGDQPPPEILQAIREQLEKMYGKPEREDWENGPESE